jgi:hypothetical protein
MSRSVRTTATSESEPRVGVKVAEALADATGVPADELDPIQRSVDPDALETVVASGAPDLRIEWSTNGHRVEVDGTGTVRVD